MMQMKYVIYITVLIIPLILILGCGKEDKHNSTEFNSENGLAVSEIKATFIELGSVSCMSCRMMQSIVQEIEEEYKGQVKVIFYDVMTADGVPYAQKYDIKLIPTQVFLDKDGNEYFRHQGFFPKDELIKVLKMQGVE